MRRIMLFLFSFFLAAFAGAQGAWLTGKVRPVENLPARKAEAISAEQWMRQCDTTLFWPRERLIVEQVLSGNVPDSLRLLHEIAFITPVIDSVEVLRQPHEVRIWVSPDYVAIGEDARFVRMPMGPLAAQEIVDSLHCILPTALMVNRINEVAQGAIEPFPFRPVADRNCQPRVFEDSNNAINALMKARGYHFGQFISGLKKDIILTCRLMEGDRYRHNVAIYGWHYPDGRRIQPVHVKHVNWYVDYSHGVRLVSRRCTVDGKEMDIRAILESPALYRLLSDEPSPIIPAAYMK
ncbi:MAG: hypothetical protein Q4B68_02165 [Bacteroidales bacterium]|nr:hypothetical protein [Bacteroidales bacterium]